MIYDLNSQLQFLAEVDSALLLRDYLQLSDFDVDVYFSSEEASENVSGGRYGLTVLDVLMNGIDGFELYKRFSKIDSNLRVCFLTGCEINASKFTDLPENKTKIIQKPIHLTKLLEVVRTLLNDNKSDSDKTLVMFLWIFFTECATSQHRLYDNNHVLSRYSLQYLRD